MEYQKLDVYDGRYRASILKQRIRVYFDPSNKKHIEDYAFFVKNSKWKDGCNYLLEVPFEDIPTMISHKLMKHFLQPYMKHK
jgi:hypothetical protein